MSETKPVMSFEIHADPEEITEMECPYGSVSIIPFHAKVDSELFCGETLPGAADVQQENAAGLRRMSARYAFRGTDCNGNACTLFVENEGWFRGEEKHSNVIHTFPLMLCDSPVIGDYLARRRFRGEVVNENGKTEIRIYDTFESGIKN